MTPKWQELGQQLGIDEDLLDEIYTNNQRDEECLRAILEVWLQISMNPKWSDVTDAILKIGKDHLALSCKIGNSDLGLSLSSKVSVSLLVILVKMPVVQKCM